MILPEEDAKLFYKLYWSLLYYANMQTTTIKGLSGPDFTDQDPDEVYSLHEWCFSHTWRIDSFIAENPTGLTSEELAMVKSWNNHVTGEFIIAVHQSDHTIFLSMGHEQRAFGVIGLYEEFEDIYELPLPTLIETTLLPFKGRIIYSGFLRTSGFQLGPVLSKAVRRWVREAIIKFGIIRSLETTDSGFTESDERLIRFYAKSEDTRMEYAHEIDDLLYRKPSLKPLYFREVGRSNARGVSKRLSEIGVGAGWFALYKDVIIASGQTEDDVKTRLKEMHPDGYDGVHIFKHARARRRKARRLGGGGVEP